MDSIWWSVIIGLLFGGILSLLFDTLSKKSSSSKSRNFIGMDSQALITDSIVLIVVASFVFLSTVSVLIRDLDYPTKSPVKFTIETLMMSIIPSVTIFAMTSFRGYKITSSTFEEFSILAVKFGLLHILLQFSGFYSYVFPPK